MVDQYSKVDKEIGNLDKALGKNDEALEKNGEELGIHSTVLDDWKATAVTAADEVNESTGKTQEEIDALAMSLSELQDKYTETYIKALESLDKQYGAFDKIEQKAAVSTKSSLET